MVGRTLIFTPEDQEDASLLAREMGVLRNSIETGRGSMAGFLGEIAAQRVYGGEISHTYEYDLILPDGRTADVKTKRTRTEPLDYYECSVADFNTRQRCDIYIFCRVHYDLTRAWVLGHYDKKKYMEDSRLLRRGEKDGDNGFIVRADCHNMRIDQLEKPDA